jgi:hypothetical protein
MCHLEFQTGLISSIKVERYSNPITGLDRPRGFQEVKVPIFQDNRHMKVELLLTRLFKYFTSQLVALQLCL